MRYLIKFSYNGSKFYGFQRQSDKKNVQSEIEKALTIINKSNVLIKGAGRTDAKVHAYDQAASFDLDFDIPEYRLVNALNSIVRPYININECIKVSNDFHARFNVTSKKYVYKIWTGVFDPLKSDYYLFYEKNIDLGKLRECARVFIGVHDFHNFVAGERDNYISSIFDINVDKLDDEITISFYGKSFYRYMVRNLVGAMLSYNEDKCDIKLIRKMLDDKNFNFQLETAPPTGLYLMEVNY